MSYYKSVSPNLQPQGGFPKYAEPTNSVYDEKPEQKEGGHSNRNRPPLTLYNLDDPEQAKEQSEVAERAREYARRRNRR